MCSLIALRGDSMLGRRIRPLGRCCFASPEWPNPLLPLRASRCTQCMLVYTLRRACPLPPTHHDTTVSPILYSHIIHTCDMPMCDMPSPTCRHLPAIPAPYVTVFSVGYGAGMVHVANRKRAVGDAASVLFSASTSSEYRFMRCL